MRRTLSPLHTASGQPLHPVGIGTWRFGGYPTFSPGTDSEVQAVRYALQLGQNHIDTAEMYARGGAESVVGKAIEGLAREDIFIASKLWKDHVAAGTVRPAVEAMLQRLGTDYLDMLYIHAPWFDTPWVEAIPQINDLIDAGLVRHLGVSNCNAPHLRTAPERSRHGIAANQMHYSLTHPQEITPDLRDLCAGNNIALVAYSPLEQGALLTEPLVQELANNYDSTPSQIALAWLLAKGALPIPKAVRRPHIVANAAAPTIKLSAHDFGRLDGLTGK